jgi:putative addiction module component (TIGR02574 family)
MTTRGEHVLEEALSLPPRERAEIAERILSSLDLATQQENDRLCAQEVESRIDAYERGELKTVPADEVFKKIKAQQKS